MSNIENIPSNWAEVALGVIAEKITKGSTPTTYGFPFLSHGINFIKIENVKRGVIDLKSISDFISHEAHENQKKSQLSENDILFSIAGTIGEIAIVRDIHLPANTNQAFAIIAGYDSVLVPKLLEYQLRSFVSQKTRSKARGGAMNNVSLGDLKELGVFVPPLNEQHRIVAKIEELFSELDKGIESLKTAGEQLKVYRQSLLKHAFEGKLTGQWRAENTDKLETADELLACIQQEREARYQQQLEEWNKAVKEWEGNGKEGKKPGKPTSIKVLDIPARSELEYCEQIPEEWLWVKYGDLCSAVRNGISAKPVGNDGDKIFRISAVRPMYFDMEDYRFIDNSGGVYDSFYLQAGDLVFTRYNGSRRYVGVCAEYTSEEPRLYPDKLIQTRPDLPLLNSSYLEKALNSGGSRKFIESKIRTTAGQSGVSGGDVKNIPVPICSLEEQIEISRILDEKLTCINDLECILETECARAESLRQSILKIAFSGQLVPQDPNDEPASELLKRIAEEKAQMEKAAKEAKAATRKPKKKVADKTAAKKKVKSQ